MSGCSVYMGSAVYSCPDSGALHCSLLGQHNSHGELNNPLQHTVLCCAGNGVEGGGEAAAGQAAPPNGAAARLAAQETKKPARRMGAKPPPDRVQRAIGCLSLQNPIRQHS